MHVLRRSIDSAPEVLSGLKFLRDWWGAYAKKGQMHCHLSWHLALWELELGNTQARGKSIVHPGASRGPPLNALSDCASFLFRAELAGELRDPNYTGRPGTRPSAELSPLMAEHELVGGNAKMTASARIVVAPASCSRAPEPQRPADAA